MIAGKLPKGRDIRQAFQRSNKKPISTHTLTSSNTDSGSSLFPNTGHRLGSTPSPASCTGSNLDDTHVFLQPSHTATSHPTPATIVLDTSSESDTDIIDLAERMTLKRMSVSSGMMGRLNGKRPFYSSSDTDSDRYDLNRLGSSTQSHKKLHAIESETGKVQETTSLQGPSRERTTLQTDDTDACANTATCDRAEVICPNCALSVAASSINQHLDDCLT